jgi:hypothetical protein
MKKPNIDFSKQGIQKFLLYHVEKIFLAIGIVLLGVFFWLGFSTPKYDKQTPKGLVDLSQRAHSHIVSDTSWNEISKFRQADDAAPQRIEQAENKRIKPEAYPYQYVLGTPVMTAGLRKDPELNPAQYLMADSFPASVLLTTRGNDALNKLELAAETVSGDAFGGGDRDRGGGIGSGGGGGGGLPDEGGSRRPDRASSATKRTPTRDDGVIAPGDVLPTYERQELAGVRPNFLQLSSSSNRAWLCNVTAVTGIVRFENQSQKFNQVLASARGYYPKRDRPIYQYMQIMRQEEGDDPDKWEDITDKIMEQQVARYTDFAPEVVDPEFYDPVLTSPIPTMTQVDYRDYCLWPLPGHDLPTDLNAPKDFTGITMREMMAGKTDAKSGKEEQAPKDPFATPAAGEESRPAAGDKSGGGRGGRDRGGRDRGGRDRGGPGDGIPSSGERPDAPSSSEIAEEVQVGSDRSIYEAVADSMSKRAPYRLVRFFDIETVGKNDKPKKVRYKVRLWLRDPNNENPDKEAYDKARKPGGDRGRGIGAGGGASGAGLPDDGPPPGGDRGDRGGAGGKGRADEPEDTSVYVAVTDKMLDPEVRERISSQRANPEYPPDKKLLEYTVPTEWSEPTDWVVVGGENQAEMFAGRIDPPKTTKINDQYLEKGEPVANIAAVTWNADFGIPVPANREARRSDVLNFTALAHILHPIDWTVRKIPDANIETNAMVVDMMGGREIRELNNSRSPIKYYLPGEVLLMGANGELIVRNNSEDKQDYFHALLLEDEIAEMGGKKKVADEEDKSRDRDRGRGGGDSSPPGF